MGNPLSSETSSPTEGSLDAVQGMVTLEDVAERIASRLTPDKEQPEPKPNTVDEWTSSCPIHDDKRASFWFAMKNGRIVFKCSAQALGDNARCANKQILSALGLTRENVGWGERSGSGKQRGQKPTESDLEMAASKGTTLTLADVEELFDFDAVNDPSHVAGKWIADRWGTTAAARVASERVLAYKSQGKQLVFVFHEPYRSDSGEKLVRYVQYRALENDRNRWQFHPGSQAKVGVLRAGEPSSPILVAEGPTDAIGMFLDAPSDYGIAVVGGASNREALTELVALFGFDRPFLFISDNDDVGVSMTQEFTNRLLSWGVPALLRTPKPVDGDDGQQINDYDRFRRVYGPEAARDTLLRLDKADLDAANRNVVQQTVLDDFFDLNDWTLAQGFVLFHRDILALNKERSPIVEAGGVWQPLGLNQLTVMMAKWLEIEAGHLKAKGLDEGNNKQRLRLILNAQSNNRRRSISSDVLSVLATEARETLGIRVMDGGEYFLGVSAGKAVVDLRTGRIVNDALPSDKGLMVSSPTRWEGIDAPCPHWDEFLATCLPEESKRFALQEALGYAICGNPRESVMFQLVGRAYSGKSTVLETIGNVLGDYATVMDEKLLTKQGAHESEAVSLFGKRFAFFTDGLEEELSATALKKFASAGSIKARELYKESFQFKSTHVPFTQSNQMPTFDNADSGALRRILLIRFEIPYDASADTHTRRLEDRLEDEYPGILAWLVRGAVQYAGKQGGRLAFCYDLVEDTVFSVQDSNPHIEFVEALIRKVQKRNADPQIDAVFHNFLSNDDAFEIWRKNHSSSGQRRMAQALKGTAWKPTRMGRERIRGITLDESALDLPTHKNMKRWYDEFRTQPHVFKRISGDQIEDDAFLEMQEPAQPAVAHEPFEVFTKASENVRSGGKYSEEQCAAAFRLAITSHAAEDFPLLTDYQGVVEFSQMIADSVGLDDSYDVPKRLEVRMANYLFEEFGSDD